MAKAYKCDRCGNFFEKDKFVSPIMVCKEYHILSYLEQERYDLCPECQKELEAFVHYERK